MGRLALAWKVLTSSTLASQFQDFLDTQDKSPAGSTKSSEPAKLPETGKTSGIGKAVAAGPAGPPSGATPHPAVRSDAVTLLATLQREGRLVDFLKEPLEGYSDAQVGAAVRDIHRDCAAILERQFAVRPVLEQPEGSQVSVGDGVETGRIRISGRSSDAGASTGRLVHHGWQVTRCQLPQWTGGAVSANVIIPADVEVSGTGR